MKTDENKILVPVDFSQASHQAATIAATIAKKRNLQVSLLHVQSDKPDNGAEEKLRGLSEKLHSDTLVPFDYLVRKGSIFKVIPGIACEHCYGLMVIGSHGIKGVREKFFGADILKLVKEIPVPVLVIQKQYDFPSAGLKTILFPASSHFDFSLKIEATINLARMFDSEIHLYTIEKPELEWSKELIANIEKAKHAFETHKIKFQRVSEKQTTFSVGYSKQILQYAHRISADVIALMSVPTDEHYYIADSDKESILTNAMKIPVYCISNKRKV
jgi:nucleotide-binding universal stress UspA family protein